MCWGGGGFGLSLGFSLGFRLLFWGLWCCCLVRFGMSSLPFWVGWLVGWLVSRHPVCHLSGHGDVCKEEHWGAGLSLKGFRA